jgi:hypothetical protein
MIKVVVLAVIELKQVLKIVEDLADYIALGVTGEIEKQRCPNKKSTLVDNERRFKRACVQIVQLNYSLDALQQRYNKAKKDNHKFCFIGNDVHYFSKQFLS